MKKPPIMVEWAGISDNTNQQGLARIRIPIGSTTKPRSRKYNADPMSATGRHCDQHPSIDRMLHLSPVSNGSINQNITAAPMYNGDRQQHGYVFVPKQGQGRGKRNHDIDRPNPQSMCRGPTRPKPMMARPAKQNNWSATIDGWAVR